MSDQLYGSPVKPPREASGISAADKRTELEARGEERPRCECHGEPQLWQKQNCLSGGYWRCIVRMREAHARYYAANLKKINENVARYKSANPEKVREWEANFLTSLKADPVRLARRRGQQRDWDRLNR